MFFDIGLNEVAEKYLNDTKISNIDGNLLNTSLDYWNKNLDNIIKYCIKDCELTKNIARILIDSIKKNVGLPKTLVSVASLTKQYFRLNSFIPSISYVPEKVLQAGYDSYFGGRFDTFKRGTFDNVYLYDIVSQYPSYIKDLPNLRNGLWFKTLEIPKKQAFAFYLVELNIPSNVIIPSIPMKDKTVNIFPCGYIKRWMTWFDVDLMRDYVIKVHKGYVFEKSPYNKKPFEKGIIHLFNKKAEVKGKSDIDYNIFKKTMNALGGCFIENHLIETLEKPKYLNKIKQELKAGIMFNSVYASQILAFGRWSVLKDIPIKEHNHIIAIHTDSIHTDKPMDKYLDIGVELGQWNLDKEGKGLSLTTGMYQIDDMVKTRGIPKKYIVNWFDFCKKHSKETRVEFIIPLMKKIREGLVQDKCLVKVNTIVDYKRSVLCSFNDKRSWFKDFKNFKEVLNTNHNSLAHVLYKDDPEFYMNEKCSLYRWDNAEPFYKERLVNKKLIKIKRKKPMQKKKYKFDNRNPKKQQLAIDNYYSVKSINFRFITIRKMLDSRYYTVISDFDIRNIMNAYPNWSNLDYVNELINQYNIGDLIDSDIVEIDELELRENKQLEAMREYYENKEKN